MPNSPYLDLDRDLETLRDLVDEHEAEKRHKQTVRHTIERCFEKKTRNAWEPVYPKPVALAS